MTRNKKVDFFVVFFREFMLLYSCSTVNVFAVYCTGGIIIRPPGTTVPDGLMFHRRFFFL